MVVSSRVVLLVLSTGVLLFNIVTYLLVEDRSLESFMSSAVPPLLFIILCTVKPLRKRGWVTFRKFTVGRMGVTFVALAIGLSSFWLLKDQYFILSIVFTGILPVLIVLGYNYFRK